MAKKKKPAKNPAPYEITTNFLIKQIAWKNGQPYWTVTMQLNTLISEAFFSYQVKFEFDDSSLESLIEQAKAEKESILADSQLFKESQKKSAEQKDEEIEDLENEIAAKQKEYGEIEFGAVVSKIDLSGKTPAIELVVSDETVAKLNQKKNILNFFRAVFIPGSGHKIIKWNLKSSE